MYKFILEGVQLPVAPQKMSINTDIGSETMELVNGEEISFLKAPGLKEISFDILIPAVKYPFAEYPDGFIEQAEYLEHFKKLYESKKPFMFYVYRALPEGKMLFDTSMRVSLEKFDINNEASDGFDVTASIELKEYREHKTIICKVVEQGVKGLKKEEVRPSEKQEPKTYTVKSGDSLWSICKSQLGDGGRYKEIASLNGIKNPSLIYPGQVIKFG